jgi:hypothetical protein
MKILLEIIGNYCYRRITVGLKLMNGRHKFEGIGD